MRVTRAQLQEMIDQEVAAALLLSENRRLVESDESRIYESCVHELLEFSRAYSSLPGHLRDSLHAMVTEGRRPSHEHVKLIEGKLGGKNKELDETMAASRALID